MKTIAFNSLNDVFRGLDGNIAMLTGIDACQQCCITAMQAIRGEMIYAQDKGMPYFETVFNTYNPAAFEAAARLTLLAVPNVTAVVSFAQQLQEDDLIYVAQIMTTFSTTPVTVSNGS